MKKTSRKLNVYERVILKVIFPGNFHKLSCRLFRNVSAKVLRV